MGVLVALDGPAAVAVDVAVNEHEADGVSDVDGVPVTEGVPVLEEDDVAELLADADDDSDDDDMVRAALRGKRTNEDENARCDEV